MNAGRSPDFREKRLTLREVAYLTGARERVIERMVSFDLVEPADREWQFPPEVVPYIRRLLRLHADLGISWSSMPMVLDLLERIEELERQLEGRR